jgi:uncharacterized protein (DUF2267 family)
MMASSGGRVGIAAEEGKAAGCGRRQAPFATREEISCSCAQLRTVLQALRDWLPVNEAASFGAQLPELLRGIYYEHWRPAATPVKPRHKADFVARIADAFKVDPFFVSEDAVAIVFELLTDKLTRGEIENVRHALPADIRAIWPLPSQAA